MTMQHDTTCADGACDSNRTIDHSRRQFLVRTGMMAAAAATATSALPRVALGAPPGQARDVLVVMFMRGGMDGLSLCVPYGDAELYNRRPTLAIRPPGQTDGAIDLDGFFGLAPSAQPLLAAYQAGDLAFVHASGSPDPTRSHFEAQKFMEAGAPNQAANLPASGWLARHLQTSPPMSSGPLRAISVDYLMTRSLTDGPAALPIPDLSGFVMPGDAATAARRRRALLRMYVPPSTAQATSLGAAALDTVQTIDLLGSIDFAHYVPSNGASYPQTSFGNKARSAAALIKAHAGVECIEIDLEGWDMHTNLGPLQGAMANHVDHLARTLAAFYADMGNGMRNVTVVVMSEFGRRAAQNGNFGADHGHGNCMIVLGGGIHGGQVLCQWPGLAPAQLDNGDLAITIDYRDILGEILARRLHSSNVATVFPSYTPVFRGIAY
jgi:uncharacterized protein (DUF1501 family)